MKKIGMDILSNAKAAESTLRRVERQSLGTGLPQGHPLIDELDKVKAEAGGDLEGLPENHPLILEMKAAEARYKQTQEQEQQSSKTENKVEQKSKLKQAQKIDRVKSHREKIVAEEEDSEKLRVAAKEVNISVDTAISAVRGLYEVLEKNDNALNKNRMNAARVVRLKRLLYAFERGVSETRMSRS